MAKGKRPDYSVSFIMRGDDSQKGNIGVAWKNDNGRISIKLNPKVVLEWHPDLFITLFPEDGQKQRNNDDDDIPF